MFASCEDGLAFLKIRWDDPAPQVESCHVVRHSPGSHRLCRRDTAADRLFLNLFRLLKAESNAYLALNLVGASLACASSYLIDFLPFVLLEGTWAIVAGVALARKLRTARQITR